MASVKRRVVIVDGAGDAILTNRLPRDEFETILSAVVVTE
jgi:hypothetical protein